MPSHTGLVGNGKADEEAKRAAVGNQAGEYSLPHTDYYPVLRKTVKEMAKRMGYGRPQSAWEVIHCGTQHILINFSPCFLWFSI